MVKYFCDICGNEIEGRTYEIRMLVHIKSYESGYSQMVNGKMEPVSGREESIMACLPCYNEAMYPLMDRIKEMKKTKKG